MDPKKHSLADRLRRDSHRICSLILNSNLEWIDISIEINTMRETCAREAPEKLDLFEAIYVSRFTRLWQQWRYPADMPPQNDNGLPYDYEPWFPGCDAEGGDSGELLPD